MASNRIIVFSAVAAVVVGLGIWHWRDEIVPTLQKSNKSKFKPGKDGRYTISAKGIKAQFIPYGATLTNLYVKDKQGNDVDVVLGYDDVDFYPLMLTQHTYFNLEAYRNPSTDDIWSHTLHMPYAKRFLPIDSFGLPTGAIAAVTPGHIMDFASEPDLPFGRARDTPEFATNAGTEGYNHFWLFDDVPSPETVVLTLASPWNGIKADLRTDQRGVQIYSTGWSDGSAGLKSTQGTDEVKTMGRSSAVAIEPHDLVDGVNNPQWGRADAQITGPGETYTWEASWEFGLLDIRHAFGKPSLLDVHARGLEVSGMCRFVSLSSSAIFEQHATAGRVDKPFEDCFGSGSPSILVAGSRISSGAHHLPEASMLGLPEPDSQLKLEADPSR
ncbi:aldose 1-epimerase [Verticillium dahliae VdLs.17]|uniref:Aldose 1-epimerase n=1 Tax=Verticillium dahliae (strain VdLs.17 / ATCC MYA-4575 / FGSC 10137) TaxID=498257 RepID=G2X426_VERDV|nr:aldose 1-epimerase [Verticillium dahliae VdLs.17]EGY23325.1 aldose 1-epimerase [Verticillium dahliae VdLs.17]